MSLTISKPITDGMDWLELRREDLFPSQKYPPRLLLHVKFLMIDGEKMQLPAP